MDESADGGWQSNRRPCNPLELMPVKRGGTPNKCVTCTSGTAILMFVLDTCTPNPKPFCPKETSRL